MASTTRVAALDELEVVAGEISALHGDLAQLLVAEHETKTQAWFGAHESQFISERDRIADHASLSLTLDIIRARGELAAAESRRAYLEFVVHWGAP